MYSFIHIKYKKKLRNCGVFCINQVVVYQKLTRKLNWLIQRAV
jgi:hypothetical protein